jgi:Flp pilus assembly pilin Flp
VSAWRSCDPSTADGGVWAGRELTRILQFRDARAASDAYYCFPADPKEVPLERAPFGVIMSEVFSRLWAQDEGQDIAEYAVMLAVILVIVVGTLRLIGSNANNAFSSVASSIQ